MRALPKFVLLAILLGAVLVSGAACAARAGIHLAKAGYKAATSGDENDPVTVGTTTFSHAGRDVIMFVPTHLPPEGSRTLVVVLHGGGGNAERIASKSNESALNMNDEAEKYGFIVAYLNGTHAMRLIGANMHTWNAGGGCCGQAFQNNVDDVSYITSTVGFLADKYGVDRQRMFGMGHSNGAMMTQRLMCENGLYAAAVPVSGGLQQPTENCPGARGKRILAIHGVDDENVPIGGGMGTKGPEKKVYVSEAYSRDVFTKAGAEYTIEAVQGADHKVDNISEALQRSEGVTLAEKAARFFGLAQ